MLLETARLLFRAHEPADEAAFIAMQTDPRVREYAGGGAWPVEKARERFRNSYLGRERAPFGLWATILKEKRRLHRMLRPHR